MEYKYIHVYKPSMQKLKDIQEVIHLFHGLKNLVL